MLLTNSTPVFSLITSDLIYLSFVLKLTQNVWFDVFEKWNLLWYLQNLATKRSHVSFLFRGHRFSQTSLTVGDFFSFATKLTQKDFYLCHHLLRYLSALSLIIVFLQVYYGISINQLNINICLRKNIYQENSFWCSFFSKIYFEMKLIHDSIVLVTDKDMFMQAFLVQIYLHMSIC